MSVQKNVHFREVKPKALPKKSVRAEEQNKSTIVEQLIDLSKLKADGVLTELAINDCKWAVFICSLL